MQNLLPCQIELLLICSFPQYGHVAFHDSVAMVIPPTTYIRNFCTQTVKKRFCSRIPTLFHELHVLHQKSLQRLWSGMWGKLVDLLEPAVDCVAQVGRLRLVHLYRSPGGNGR